VQITVTIRTIRSIYINTRSLRAAKNIVSKYKTAAKQELDNRSLNWEDNMIEVEIDDDDDLIRDVRLDALSIVSL
jgi:hypothetical protein